MSEPRSPLGQSSFVRLRFADGDEIELLLEMTADEFGDLFKAALQKNVPIKVTNRGRALWINPQRVNFFDDQEANE